VDTGKGVFLNERFRLETPQPATPNSVVETVVKLVDHFQWKGPIGCGFPAAMKKDKVLTAANIDKSWIGKNVGELIREATLCPTHVLNDVDAAGLAEINFGAGREKNGTVIMVSLGTGIGTAIFTNGFLVTNSEFGQIILKNGIEAELYASNATRKKEELSWIDWTNRLNQFFGYMDDLLWPDLYIVGGGVVKYHDQYLHKLQSKTADIVPAELLNHAGIIGSALSYKYAEDRLQIIHREG